MILPTWEIIMNVMMGFIGIKAFYQSTSILKKISAETIENLREPKKKFKKD